MFSFLLQLLLLLVVAALVASYVWLRQRVKKLEKVLNVDTPAFPVTVAKAEELIGKALRDYERKRGAQ